ncbi:MAG: hypothetical protein IPM92_00620 [Saprospiraceae bacterium]|nr:hypothetical protein [Saprospiraceae bacterium]
MKTQLISILFLFSLAFVTFSCGDDKETTKPCSTAYADELQNEINALSAAAQAYGLNPNATTCLAYKNAAQAYVNALEPYGNCPGLTGQLRTDWEASLNAAKASVAAIQC